jgi:hypothetical protein
LRPQLPASLGAGDKVSSQQSKGGTMRQITADLQAVQRVRSPRARVTCTVETRGQNPAAPALAWEELVSNAGQSAFWPVAAVGLANGNVLWFQAHTSQLRKYTVTNPHLAASWSGLTPTTLVGATMLSLAALRVPSSSTIRLWYINTSNNVQYIESSNNGSSWGGAVTVYSGGDAVLDLVVAHIDNGTTSNGPWFFGFSTYDSGTGIYTPRFGYFNGSSWVTHAYAVGWRAAGIDAYGAVTTAHRVLVFRQRGQGASRLRVVNKSASAYVDPEDIDQTQAGLFGLELSYYRFCQLPEANCMLGVAGEGAYGAGVYLGVAGLFSGPEGAPGSSTLADEPVALPAISALNSQPYSCLCSVGSDVYLVGDTVVYRGVGQTASGATLEPIRYTYDDHELRIEFQASGDALAAALKVGQILVITRTLSWAGDLGAQSGSESLRIMIVRVEHGTDLIKVIALDAVGWLGTARCRRPSTLNDGTADGVAQVMRRLAARFGIEVGVDNSSLESESVMPFTLAPAESLRGAAFRVGSQAEFYLVPANDGSFALTMITPGVSDSGDYDDTTHEYGVSPSEQPIARAALISDYRNLAFSYVLGTYSTDPEDGAAVAMAAGPVLPTMRPLPYSLTNSRYNTTSRVQQAADAEAARQRRLPVTALIEGQANLALELYDRVEVTEARLGWGPEGSPRQFRVRRIVERWEKGQLWQTVYLGDE